MSATTPTAAATSWKNAPAEYRRNATFGAVAKAVIPAVSLATLALALASGNPDAIAWIGPAGMIIMTLVKGAANMRVRRAATLTLPSEHKVRFPRLLGNLIGALSIACHVAFAALCLASHLPFATPFAIFVGVSTVIFAAQGLYDATVEGLQIAITLAAGAAVLAAISAWSPESLPTALAWTIGTSLVCAGITFMGDAIEDKFETSDLRSWAVKPYLALRHSKVASAR